MQPSESFRTDEKAARKQTSPGTAVRTDLVPQHRRMKTYSVNSTEFLAMPLLSFVASLVLGAGFWVLQLSFEAKDTKFEDKLWYTGIGLCLLAVLVQAGYFIYYAIIKQESKSTIKSG